MVKRFLLAVVAPTWTAEGIKVFGWLAQVASTVLFIVGLSSPDYSL